MKFNDDQRIRMHKDMLLVRACEEGIARVYPDQEICTPTHLGSGQEAVAVGVCAVLGQSDIAVSHHRGHNHYLAKGGDVYRLIAELYGREDGCAHGRGGSVHLTDRSVGFLGTSAIVGQMIAVATGVALSMKMDGLSNVAVSFFGDAACEEGVFYEALNFAAIHKLPVLFVCENNLYSTESPMNVRAAYGTTIPGRAEALGVVAETVDGNDVLAVADAALRFTTKLRDGGGPMLLECMTYRLREHVGPFRDHELGRGYRSEAEYLEWVARCPIKKSGDQLFADGLASEHDLTAWADAAETQISVGIEKARQAEWPQARDLFKNVYQPLAENEH